MVHDLLAIASGSLVGTVLGLVGGGGSVLAVPLLIYLVGVKSVHVALGTSAVAVAVSAMSSLAAHARAGNVRWPCALVFAATGMMGAAAGAAVGKQFDGERLLVVFGLLMLLVAVAMLHPVSRNSDHAFAPLNARNARVLLPRLAGFGVGTGVLSGFFGIGGGFLIAPSLVVSARLPLLSAIGSSLVSVAAFGLTTAVSYGASGLIDWRLAGMFVCGGIGGSLLGRNLALKLGGRTQPLSFVFAAIVAGVGIYLTASGVWALLR